ncbi:2774_t:CDS:2, partial [Cetraspora pellucida]
NEDDFNIIHWKYFYSFQKAYTEFSVASVIAVGDPAQEFEPSEIPLSIPYCMFTVLVSHESRELGDSTYFDASCYQYNSHTNSKNVHMKMRIFYSTNAPRFSYLRVNNSLKIGRTFIVSGFIKRVTSKFIMLEVTDIDFMTANVNITKNAQEFTSSTITDRRSDIDRIAEDTVSASSQTLKRPRRVTTRATKHNTTLDALELAIHDNTQDRRTQVEDAPEDGGDDLEYLDEQEVKVESKTGRT